MRMHLFVLRAAVCVLAVATTGCHAFVASAGSSHQDAAGAWRVASDRPSFQNPAHGLGGSKAVPVAFRAEQSPDVETTFLAPIDPASMGQRARGAVLDVWLNNREGDLRSLTGERSLGTAVVQGDYFRYNKVNSVPDLRAFWGKPMLLKWTGLLEVTERGPHVFVFELSKESGRNISVQTLIVLNEETVFERRARTSGRISEVDSRVLTLAPGFYRLEVWLAADHRPAWPPSVDSQFGTYIKIRFPSDRTPRPLPSSRIWHRTR